MDRAPIYQGISSAKLMSQPLPFAEEHRQGKGDDVPSVATLTASGASAKMNANSTNDRLVICASCGRHRQAGDRMTVVKGHHIEPGEGAPRRD